MNQTGEQFQDKILRCCDCGNSFVFTAGEQVFYSSKQLSEPKRCPNCRKIRRLTLVPDEKVRRQLLKGKEMERNRIDLNSARREDH